MKNCIENTFMNTSVKNQSYHINHFSISVPLDYSDQNSQNIDIHLEEITYKDNKENNLPYLVYIQGGPGFERPQIENISGWLDIALKSYKVLLFDQRGTGKSYPITNKLIQKIDTNKQLAFLSNFRADSIVRDLEAIREKLNVKQWALLGQSFGGFCIMTYLSHYPDSIIKAFVTGGIPPIDIHPDDVYRATFKKTKEKNKQFFNKYPDLQKKVQCIANFIQNNEVKLPNGQLFTVEQFQIAGMYLGQEGGAQKLHEIIDDGYNYLRANSLLSDAFLNEMLSIQVFQTNPLYIILHEAIYCEGFASNWSAESVRNSLEEFNFKVGSPFYFTGEMVFPWMLSQMKMLKHFEGVGNQIAQKNNWKHLYDINQLKNNKVPVAAFVYKEDMYVDYELSQQTIQHIANLTQIVHSSYEHNAIKIHGKEIFEALEKI
ncbi:alpha/beta fold hydrolase [Paraphotobacterium marinum]|nr:alpha/beta fold hydrolase [Paraphotobacterium marinum]